MNLRIDTNQSLKMSILNATAAFGKMINWTAII